MGVTPVALTAAYGESYSAILIPTATATSYCVETTVGPLTCSITGSTATLSTAPAESSGWRRGSAYNLLQNRTGTTHNRYGRHCAQGHRGLGHNAARLDRFTLATAVAGVREPVDHGDELAAHVAGLPWRHQTSLHSLSKLGEGLAWQAGQQLESGELVDAGGLMLHVA